jgi:signal transduction histidine kinase
LVILFSRLETINFETLPILGLPLIRAFAFGMIGHIVTRLITTQRQQESKLLSANIKLSEHALTLEQLATSRERNRLARELHDTLAHTLSGLTVNLEAIKIMLGSGNPEVMERIDHALSGARSGLTDTRRALRDLRVKQVEDLGLKIALENLCLQAASRGGFEIQLNLPEIIPESTIQIEQVYYRIAQESLENIIKHAEADLVRLSLFLEGKSYTMVIADDGVGFDPQLDPSPDALGLRGMKERAAECGCNFEIHSQPEGGTEIRIIAELNHVQDPDL